MLEILNNIEIPLIIIGGILTLICGGWFIQCVDQNDSANRPFAIFGFAIGLLMFFAGWAIPDVPEVPKPEPAPQEVAQKLFQECVSSVGSVNDSPDVRLKCIRVVREQIELFAIDNKPRKEQVNAQPQAIPPQ